MIYVVLLATGVLNGLGPGRALLLAGAVYAPVPSLALAALAVWRRRRSTPASAVGFCDAVAAELRSGSSLRGAIASSAGPAGAHRLAAASIGAASLESLAGEARRAFPQVGLELAMTIPAVARSGSRGADLFDEIGTLALAQSEVAREVRVASAPARATAAVFVFAPTGFLVSQLHMGGIGRLLELPGQGAVAGIGLALFVAGLLTAVVIARKAG